jgi:hypothetical protein
MISGVIEVITPAASNVLNVLRLTIQTPLSGKLRARHAPGRPLSGYWATLITVGAAGALMFMGRRKVHRHNSKPTPYNAMMDTHNAMTS